MLVHLVDGTYELFRHHFAVPSHVDPDGIEVAATRGVVGSVLGMLEGGATHVGVATDHVVESFRNELYAGYKTSEGMDPELLAQFPRARGRAAGARRRRCGRWSRSRPTTRSRARPRSSAARTSGSSR